MKKYLILAVTAAIAAVGCTKTYEAVPVETNSIPIGFGSWAETLTKAHTGRTIGGTEFAANDYFFVYGYTSGTQTPFDGDKVTASGTTSLTWAYDPIRFWDRNNDYYDFYAISPSEDSHATAASLVDSHDVTTGSFTTKSLTLEGNDNDILVADKKHVLKANYGQEVLLNFRHAAALFDLKVRKGAGLGDNGVLKITAVSLENIDKTGTFTVASYKAENDATPYKANIAWTATDRGSYNQGNGVNTVTTISAETPITTTGDQYLINNLVVMPQIFRNTGDVKQRLKISYTITTGTGATEQTNSFTDKTYDLYLFDTTDYPTDDNTSTDGNQYNDGTQVTGWVDGVHYTYIITIDAEAIVFNASIQPWGTDNGYHYLLN